MNDNRPSNPFGLRAVTPYLVVADVPAMIEFTETYFGAVLRMESHEHEDGTIMHAEVTIGDSVVMMGTPMGDVEASVTSLYVYVEDCDATWKQAVDQGAESVLAPADYPHGDRYGGFKDPCGNTWWAVTHVGK